MKLQPDGRLGPRLGLVTVGERPGAARSSSATDAGTASASAVSPAPRWSTATPLRPPEQRRQRHRIDTLDRAWVRNRDDVDALRELHAAIADHLAESAGSR